MPKINAFQEFASIYDSITDPSLKFQYFLNKVLKNKKPARILDLGCGTGKITLPLAEKGFQVSGADASQEMLAVLKKKAEARQQKIKLYCGEISKKKLREKFDFIVSCDCLDHVVEEKKLFQNFKAVFNLLEKKGKFVFDLCTKVYFQKQMAEHFYGGRVGSKFFVWDDSFEGNVYKINLSIFVPQGKNKFHRIKEVILKKAYPAKKIKKMLKQAGFASVKVYGQKFSQPSPSDEILFFMAEK